MLRRGGAGGTGGGLLSSSITAANSPSLQRRRGKSQSNKCLINPVILLVIVALTISATSWWFYYSLPAQDVIEEVEKEAGVVGQELTKRAIRAEHKVENFFHKSSTSSQQQMQGSTSDTKLSPSERMAAQSSRWVDGEKALKRQLSVLMNKQQNEGVDLGVPVLTRYLGEDFPAWVTKGMDEAEWRKKVDAKYEQMRQEEEEWQRTMKQIINQRERDLGITTAR